MTHPATGNATWQDYPSTSTPITAATLEAQELALDNHEARLDAVSGALQAKAIVNQTIAAANTWTSVLYTTESHDDYGAHSIVSPDWAKFIATVAGRYRCSGNALWNNTGAAAGARGVRLAKNGTQVPQAQFPGYFPGAVFYSMIMPPVLVDLAVGDYVEMQVFTAAAGHALYATATDGSLFTVELARAA